MLEKEGVRQVKETSIDNEYWEDEFMVHYGKSTSNISRKATRLDFFGSNADDHFGYVVLRPEITVRNDYKACRICEAVIKAPSHGLTDLSAFFTCKRSYDNGVGAFPFMEPDGILGNCGHAVLQMVAGHFSQKLPVSTIREVAHENPCNLPSEGLEFPSDFQNVLKKIGIETIFYPFHEGYFEAGTKEDSPLGIFFKHKKRYSLIPPADLIYTFVESKIPVIVNLKPVSSETKEERPPGHCIVIHGHTFDPNAWWPEAVKDYYRGAIIGPEKTQYLSSVSWVDFIMHDHNFGPYLTFPERFQRDFEIVSLIVPLERRLHLKAEHVNLLALLIIDHYIEDGIFSGKTSIWQESFQRHFKEGKLLLRSFLIEKTVFLEQLENSTCCHALKSLFRERAYTDMLPDSFWLTELSSPEIFSQQRYRLGVVISDPWSDYDDNDIWKSVICAHLPGFFLVPQTVDPKNAASKKRPSFAMDLPDDIPYCHIIRN